MNITTVGIDLAKDTITVYAQDESGRGVLARNFRFKELAEWLVQLPAGCIVGMEACSSAHHWARTIEKFGHTVRLMAPQFTARKGPVARSSSRSGAERRRSR